MPRQGARGPWLVINNYFRDRKMLRKAPLEDGVLTFTHTPKATTADDRPLESTHIA